MTAHQIFRCTSVLLGFFALFSVPDLFGQDSDLAAKIAANEHALTLVQEGVALRREGKIEEALAKYQQALEMAPENPNVLYELCYTYFQLGDCDKSIEFGERGAKYQSELQGQFYTVMGSCYDQQKNPEKAIALYKKGIEVSPDAPMIRYNLALTYANTGRLEDAETTVKDELRINPEHASSHFLLALLYDNRKERIPALLASCRFLVLEPDGPRSANILDMLEKNLTRGVSKGKGEEDGKEEFNVTFNMTESTEGDFKGVELMMSMLTVGTAIDSVPQSEYRNMQHVLDLVLGMIAEKGEKGMGKGFAAAYYVPFFAEAVKQGHKDIMLRTIMMSHDDPEAQAWLSELENMKKIQDFIEWSEGFEWKGE